MSREDEWHAVRTAAAEVYTPEGVEIWLHARNRLLGNEIPADLVDRGEAERVVDVLTALAEGVIF